MNRPKRPHSQAFTLVELLVVIGIIGLLVAILIPVVGKIRISAKNAATQNELMQISGAIQNYYNDYQDYPGVTPDSRFGNLGTGYDATLAKLTSTEDLVVTLMGGYDISSGTIKYNPDALGKGPVSLNPLAPGQKNAYIDVRPGMLSPVSNDPAKLAAGKFHDEEWLDYINTFDTIIPEFVDQYDDFRPLLYLRASRAGTPQPAININSSKLANFGVYDRTAYYNMNSVQAYIKQTRIDPANAAESTRKDDVFAPMPPPVDQPRIKDYFAQQSINGGNVAAKGAGSYILISAGPDRRYGTPDDIIFFGGGGQ